MLAHNQQKIVHIITQATEKKMLHYVIFIRTKGTVSYLGEYAGAHELGFHCTCLGNEHLWV